jgi:leukotriene-A4 hydrolase
LDGKTPAKKIDTHEWVAQQWLQFLNHMPTTLTTSQMAELDQAFGFTHTANAEIEHSWLLLVIRNHYQPGNVRLETYLETVGRGKLILPLYKEMMKTPAGAVQAKRVFALARPVYHPTVQAAVDAIVTPGGDSENSDE